MAFAVSSSSRCSCSVIAGWVRPRRRAVSVMLPVSTTDISERSIRISRLMRFIESLTVRVRLLLCNFHAAMPKGASDFFADETGCGVQGPRCCSQNGLAAILNAHAEEPGRKSSFNPTNLISFGASFDDLVAAERCNAFGRRLPQRLLRFRVR